MTALDFIVLGGYFFLMIAAMFLVKPARGMNDYALGNREFPARIAFATLAATAIGPGFTTGLMGKAAGGGLIWIFIFGFFSLQMVLTGVFLAPRLRAFNGAVTLGDIMGARYGVAAKVLTGVISVLFSAGIVGVIAKATGTFIETLIGIDATVAVAVSTVVVIAYSAVGGLKADVFTDVIQFAILALGIPLVLILEAPQIAASGNALSALTWNPSSMTLPAFLGLAASFLFGEFLLPPYVARAMSARTPAAARRAFLFAAVFSMIWFVCVGVIGIYAQKIVPTASADEVFITLVRDGLPAGVTGLIVAALAAIVASSQDSFLNSGSVAFTRDIVAPFSKKGEGELRSTKLVCVAVGVLGMALALYMPSIVDALLLAYTIWAPAIVVPLTAALLFNRISPAAGIAGMICGSAATLTWSFGLHEPFGLPAIIPGLAASLLATSLGALLFRRFTGRGAFAPMPISGGLVTAPPEVIS